MYRWVIDDTGPIDPNLDAYLEEQDQGYYDFGKILCEEEQVWHVADYTDGYCFRWFFDGVQLELDPGDQVFCEEVVDPTYEPYQIDFLEEIALSGTVEVTDPDLYEFTLDEPALGIEPGEWYWTWEPAFGDEGYHDILVEVRERSTTDIGASDMIAVFVDEPLSVDDPNALYVLVTNDCDYAFEPAFTLTIPELDDLPVPTLYGEDVVPVAPQGTSMHKLEIDLSDVPPSEEGYYFELSVEPVQIFNMENPDPSEVPDALYYRFFLDNDESLNNELSWNELWEEQIDANDKWRWHVAEDEWSSAGPHTVYVEVTDDTYDPEYSGEGDRIGVATIEVTVEGDQGTGGGTDDSSGESEGGDSTDGTGDSGDTGSTADSGTGGEEEPSGGSGGGGISGMIQSIIDQILALFQGLFG